MGFGLLYTVTKLKDNSPELFPELISDKLRKFTDHVTQFTGSQLTVCFAFVYSHVWSKRFRTNRDHSGPGPTHDGGIHSVPVPCPDGSVRSSPALASFPSSGERQHDRGAIL